MSAAAPRTRAWLADGVIRSLPWLGGGLVVLTVATGLAIKATTGGLGTPLPPFIVAWRPKVDSLAIVSVSVLALAVMVAPRLALFPRSRVACAVGLYFLALVLGLAVNLARGGVRGWWLVFAGGPHGSPESRFEYLPGLPALHHGVAFYVGHFAQLVPSLPLHAAGNPPAPLVVVHVLGIRSAVALAVVCIAIGAFTAPLAYQLGRTVGDEQRGRIAGLLTAFTPSLLLFGVASADYAFAALGLCAACLLARRSGRARLAGAAVAALASLFSWLLLAIPAWAALLALRREGIRPAVQAAAACALAIGSVNLGLWLATGYDPIATLRATDAVYRRTTAARPYAYWLLGSPVAWGVMLGLPTAALGLRAMARRDPAAVALAGVVMISSLLGFTKGETERIWLPFAPLATVAAAAALPGARLRPIVCVLAAQALLVEVLFNTIW